MYISAAQLLLSRLRLRKLRSSDLQVSRLKDRFIIRGPAAKDVVVSASVSQADSLRRSRSWDPAPYSFTRRMKACTALCASLILPSHEALWRISVSQPRVMRE